jgi:hypothetical protein
VHAGRALGRGGGQHQLADDRRAGQGDLLGHEAADGKTQEVHLAELHRGDERDGVAGHLLDGVRGGAGGVADPAVVERDDPPVAGQRVDQRGIPVVQISAEVLEQDQRQHALAPAAGVTVGVLDAVGCADSLVGELRISLSHV